MYGINRVTAMIIIFLSIVLGIGGMAWLHAGMLGNSRPSKDEGLPLILAHRGPGAKLDRPAVAFDHDRHTRALNATNSQECAVCHVLKETDSGLTNPEVKVFAFPKASFDPTDKKSVMYAFHQACVSCHRNKARQGKKTGPDIGLCGKCHVKGIDTRQIEWAWSPIFTYVTHAGHVRAAANWSPSDNLNIATGVKVIGELSGKKCEVCHHTVDPGTKKLVYKRDSENSCQACHKTTDEKNVRSMRHVAHAACIGCHTTLEEKVRKAARDRGQTTLTAEEKKQFGPIECAGCHGEQKQPTIEEIRKAPRLVRGQKDVMDLSLKYVPDIAVPGAQTASLANMTSVRMKVVPFNHKAHEPRAQFCNTCHHHSLEKCSNCHTAAGPAPKGGNVSYKQAFHRPNAQQSCVGCHNRAKQDKQCAGCHQWQPADMQPTSSCAICHVGPSGGKVQDTPPMPLFTDKNKVPDVLLIKGLEKQFKPAELPHMKIVNKMVTISNSSSLARRFHATRDQALCSGCHHRSDLQQAAVQAPKCSSCHGPSFDVNALGKPGILAAYHRQCMGCHQAMNQKPAPLDCAKCHPPKKGLQTVNVIPPISANR